MKKYCFKILKELRLLNKNNRSAYPYTKQVQTDLSANNYTPAEGCAINDYSSICRQFDFFIAKIFTRIFFEFVKSRFCRCGLADDVLKLCVKNKIFQFLVIFLKLAF